MKQAKQKKIAEWTTNAFLSPERKSGWFFWATLSIGALILIGFITHNPLFVLILLLIALLWGYYEQKQHHQVRVHISDQGISIGDESIPYSAIKDFRMVYEPPEIKMLYIRLNKVLESRRGIPLEGQNPNIIRNMLAPYILEDLGEEKEPLLDSLARRFKM